MKLIQELHTLENLLTNIRKFKIIGKKMKIQLCGLITILLFIQKIESISSTAVRLLPQVVAAAQGAAKNVKKSVMPKVALALGLGTTCAAVMELHNDYFGFLELKKLDGNDLDGFFHSEPRHGIKIPIPDRFMSRYFFVDSEGIVQRLLEINPDAVLNLGE